MNRQSLRLPVDGCGGAGSRTLQVRTCSSISCLAHVSHKVFSFACDMCENVLISHFCQRVEHLDELAGSFCGFHPSLVFFVVHSMAFFFTPVRGNLCCNV